jgi:hypothetical protein
MAILAIEVFDPEPFDEQIFTSWSAAVKLSSARK